MLKEVVGAGADMSEKRGGVTEVEALIEMSGIDR